MEISNLITHVEALIFASEKPLTNIDLVELINNAFGFMDDKVTLDQVEASVDGIHSIPQTILLKASRTWIIIHGP